MALFVDLEEEAEPPQAHQYYRHGVKPEWNGERVRQLQSLSAPANGAAGIGNSHSAESGESSERPPGRETANKNGMTEALGCYP
jgi:hypothetical protein